jgi:integrase
MKLNDTARQLIGSNPATLVTNNRDGSPQVVVQRMLGHASAAMTLDVYADLFESDLDEVAVTVAKMWPREPETNARSAPKIL